jgi:hypothetical protein
MTVFSGSVFTMDVDGKATFAFEAKNFPETVELCKEDWVREDLIGMTSNGVPLCSSTAKFVNRRPTGTPYRHPKGTPLIGVLCW